MISKLVFAMPLGKCTIIAILLAVPALSYPGGFRKNLIKNYPRRNDYYYKDSQHMIPFPWPQHYKIQTHQSNPEKYIFKGSFR